VREYAELLVEAENQYWAEWIIKRLRLGRDELLIHRCDRCGAEAESRDPNYQPSGWEVVCGAELCEKCSMALHEWLRPIPEDVDNRRKKANVGLALA
jgi:hypothetical protein